MHEIRGKFNKEKADALGLTVKEKYRILQRGDPVKSDLLDIMVSSKSAQWECKISYFSPLMFSVLCLFDA